MVIEETLLQFIQSKPIALGINTWKMIWWKHNDTKGCNKKTNKNLLLLEIKWVGKGNNMGWTQDKNFLYTRYASDSPWSTALWEELKNEQNSEDIIIVTRSSHQGSTREAGLTGAWKINVGRWGKTLHVGAYMNKAQRRTSKTHLEDKEAWSDLMIKTGSSWKDVRI